MNEVDAVNEISRAKSLLFAIDALHTNTIERDNLHYSAY